MKRKSRVGYGCFVYPAAFISTIVLAVLKLSKVLVMSWLWVFSPLIALVGVIIIAIILFVCIAYVASDFYENPYM